MRFMSPSQRLYDPMSFSNAGLVGLNCPGLKCSTGIFNGVWSIFRCELVSDPILRKYDLRIYVPNNFIKVSIEFC